MKIKLRTIIIVATPLILASLIVLNWNYFRTFPLYSEVYIDHPDKIKLSYLDNPDWWDYPTLTSIRERIKGYTVKNPDINSDSVLALRELSIKKGMSAEQASLVIGEPTKKKILRTNEELWVYKGVEGGVLSWYYGWGKLRFKNGILEDIIVRYIHIYK